MPRSLVLTSLAYTSVCATALTACEPRHYTTTTVIRYRDASALHIVPPALAPARVVDDSDHSEAEYAVHAIRMPTGGPGLKWVTTATLAAGDETPVLPRPEHHCDDPDDTEHCTAVDPTPAAGTAIELNGEAAAQTIRDIIVPRLGEPSLALPACAYLRPVYTTQHVGHITTSHRGVGFATGVETPCDVAKGIAFEVASPWANVLEITTSRTIDRKRARSAMWLDGIVGGSFLLLTAGAITIGALEHGPARITVIAVSLGVSLPFALTSLVEAGSMYRDSNAKDQTTVIYPPGAP